jgi:hypothetical protein
MISRTSACVAVLAASLSWMGCSSDDGAPSTTQSSVNATTGRAALIAACVRDDDCESKICYQGDQGSYCSLKCTAENATAVCVAPMAGTCNKKGFCKKP